jgi:PUA domain protein
VTVDDGAIKFILNGADVMAPGITDVDHIIKKNDVVWIRDERGLPLAVGLALMSGIDMAQSEGGRAVAIRHYIGDELWRASKSV